MGGSSRSSSSQHSNYSQTSTVNDGDYAGASNFTVDESDRSVDDSFNTTYEYTDESDNSFNYEDNSDNSVNVDQEIDNSFTDNREIDNSFTDESDNSINDSYNTTLNNDGDFAGVQGNVTILDGGAIEESYDFARAASDNASDVAKEAVNAIGDNAYRVTEVATGAISDAAIEAIISAENTAQGGFDLSRDTLNQSLDFGVESIEALKAQSVDFADTLEKLTSASIENANAAQVNNLQAVAGLAESATTGGQAVVADASVNQVKYIAIAVAVGLAAMALGSK